MEIDDRLKELLVKLGEAINQAVGESEEIDQTMNEIKGAGYDIGLLLEVTIAIGRHATEEAAAIQPIEKDSAGAPIYTPTDEAFLKKFKITLSDPGDPQS